MTRRAMPRANRPTFSSVVLASGEIVWATDEKCFYIGDGATAGGLPFAPDDSLRPESFMLGSDAGQGIAFQRMFDKAAVIGKCEIHAGQVRYDISDQPLSITSPIMWSGSGPIESGLEGGEAATGIAFGNSLVGTRIQSNYAGGPQITFTGNARGSYLDGLMFTQSHPTPGSGWAPTAYDYLIDIQNCQGGIEFGRVVLRNINKGIRAVNSGRLVIGSVRGQCFTNGLYLDRAYDICRLDHVHFWPFWSASAGVRAYVQANLDAVTFGRVDGLFGGTVLFYDANRGIRFIDTGAGPPTKFHFDSVYLDSTRLGISAEVVEVSAAFDSFQHSGEDYTGTGTAMAGSSGISILAAADGGEFDFGIFRTERTAASPVNNLSNSTINIDRARWQNLNGAAPVVSAKGTKVLLGRREITDGSGATINEKVVTRQIDNTDFALGIYANDAAAAAGGVIVGGPYWEQSSNYVKRRAS